MSSPRTKTQTIPPRRIALPTSSTFVFSSSRNPRPDSVSPPARIDQPPQTAMSSSIVLHRQQQPPSPLGPPPPATARGRAVLSERQLMRHGAGAQDIRSTLVYARTPAGFIPFEAAPSSPQLGSPPAYDPSHNPFFPPVVVLGSGSSTISGPPTHHMPLPTVDEYFTSGPSSPSASWPVYQSAPPVSSNRPPPSSHSSQSSSSTLVSATEMATNARISGLGHRSRASVRSTGSESGLSLTELFAADWMSTAPASGSSTRRRERRTKENVSAPDLKAVSRSSRSHRNKSDQSGSESDSKCRVSPPERKPSSRYTADKVASYCKASLKPAKIVDASTLDHPTKWAPD